MGLTLYDLERKGLAACAIVFTATAYGATLCGLMLFDYLFENAGMPHAKALWIAGAFWVACMALCWWSISRKRSAWENAPASLSIFHWFQFVVISVVLLAGWLLGPEYAAPQWFGLIIEVTVGLFYFSYIFLGLTLKSPVSAAAYGWLAFAAGAAWWTHAHLH